jgi:hypothetical protein
MSCKKANLLIIPQAVMIIDVFPRQGTFWTGPDLGISSFLPHSTYTNRG